MTHEEYTEMLRAALVHANNEIHGATFREQDQFLREKLQYAAHLIGQALATPPPSNKLRPMKDAPRDGSRLLMMDGEDILRNVFFDEEWGAWNCTGIAMVDGKGWLPLPEVSE